MNVLFATAELAPLARVGGLAEAASGLVRALRDAGIDVQVVMPDYGDVVLDSPTEIEVEVPWWVGNARVRRGHHPRAGNVTLVHVPGMDRPHPYVDELGKGWPDNDHRFMAFSAVIAALVAREEPDVLHLNDWHTAATTGMLTNPPPTVLTIHTLGYQGVMDRGWLEHLPVAAHRFAWYQGTNPLAGALELVDRVIAVSPHYADEIVTEAGGMGLHDRLEALDDRLIGIRNGIDVSTWSPDSDAAIAATFSAQDRAGRAACRDDLLDQTGWDDGKIPIVAVVTRLVEQKGIDLLIDALRYFPTMPARLAILGSGDPTLTAELAAAAEASPDVIWFVDGYDEPLAHRLFAGSDLFAMPSRFEPCGLAQMQAMAYGSIPVVTDVGGLHDTVIDADANRTDGTGFVSSTVTSAGLVDAFHRAVRAWRHPARRDAIQLRGMTHDWSWAGPAARHIQVYRDLTG